MDRTKVIEAWTRQTNAEGDGLRVVGPMLYMGERPVACWLDRADETGAQIALCAIKVGRPWVVASIREVVHGLHCTLLRVPCPVVSPTPAQHAENLSYFLARWQKDLAAAARTVRRAWPEYQSAQDEAKEARLYAWAFDLPEPNPDFLRPLSAKS